MAFQAKPVRRTSNTPTIMVLVNGAWVNVKHTLWEDCMKHAGFRATLPYMRETGKPGEWHGRWFKLSGVRTKKSAVV